MTAPAPRFRTAHVAVAAAVVFAGFAAFLLSGKVQGFALTVIDDLVILAVSLTALAFVVPAARTAQSRLRSAWWTMVLALVCWNVGQVIWIYDELILRELPFPSLADPFFILFPLVACAALLLFWNRGGRYRGLILLDGLIVAGSLFIVSWLLGIGRIYDAGAASRLEFVLSLAYPFVDLVVVTIAAVVLVSAHPDQRPVMTLLTLGLICMAVADSGYAFLSAQREYFSGAAIDIGWVAGLLLIALAGSAARNAPSGESSAESDMPGWASVWLPFAPLMFAAGVLAAKPPRTASGPVLVVGLLLVVTVLARQFLSVQASRRLLADVAEQALRDPLTGLGNRALFSDRLDHALRVRARTGNAVGLVILDFDDFKFINDTLGHAAGDELLKHAARRIADTVDTGDTVARLGGDEFAVIIEGALTTPGATMQRIIQAFEKPVTVDGRELSMRSSVGLAVAAPDQDDVTADALMREADLAMYAAKRARASAGARAEVPEVLKDVEPELLQDLRLAIDQRELTLVYQPKFRLADRALVGVEALLRWPHPQRGLLTPGEFMPLIRRHGLIEPMTEFVINTALDDARTWRRAGLDIPVAVNLFPPSLAALDLPGRLDRALASRGLDASALTVEITEDALLDDIGRTRTVLTGLRERGIAVAIDDFGSGYSALWYLRDLPVDEVKLDRSFVAPITTDPRAAAVARAVIDLAHVLLMRTVAEGVENLQTADWLRRHGCDVVQGYYFSPPRSAVEVLSLRAPVAARSS